MDQTILKAFINNTALLLVLSFVYEVAYFVPSRYHRFLPVLKGLLISFICVVIMSMPFTLQPGIVYDTRSILICVTALIFGLIPTAITVAVAVIFRLIIGGAGTLAGLAVIVTSALIGLVWRSWIYPKSTKWRWLSVYAMSITVHITMLACMLLLPHPDILNIIRKIIIPVLVIYPIASVLLSQLLIRQKDIRCVQEQLKQSEEKYRKIADNVSDVIWTADLSLKTTFVSPSIERLMGETIQAHLNRTLEEKFPPDSLIKIYALFTEEMENEKNSHCDKNRTRVLELEHYRADGTTIWLAMNLSTLRDNNGRLIGFLGVSRDISEMKEQEEKLRYLSYHDQLTGLFNRRYFEKEVDRLNVESQLPLSVIIGDINGVKLINDAFGHAEGDRLIVETARLLQACCREGDILTRTGGDEFTILMPKTDFEIASKKLLEIQAACNAYNAKFSDEVYFINIALGFATKASVDESFDEVIKTAESYMYHRKLFEHKSSHSSLLASIKATMVAKSQETEEHCERLTVLAKMLGESLCLSQRELDELALLATLHDIGKVGIPESILLKPGKLSEAEWVEMKKHPEIGYRIAMATPELVAIAEYILSHQERWDGKGYPQNLAGDKIPLLSRIIAVVDAYDAMTQDRPYRKAMTHEKALEEIKNNTGKQFDPQIAQMFIKAMSVKEYKEVFS